ncbi:MAG: hypothetical protein JO071_05645 [Deltaproteobacteria bacterium]|nr:hypothetical protein [Deltaproteobacteria bacterium]
MSTYSYKTAFNTAFRTFTISWAGKMSSESDRGIASHREDTNESIRTEGTNARRHSFLWLSRFADAALDTYVFPFHHVGFAGKDCKPHIWRIDHGRPMSTYSYKTAFNTARRKAALITGFMTHAVRCDEAC